MDFFQRLVPKFARAVLLCVKMLAGLSAIVLVAVGIFQIWLSLPIHLVSVRCYSFGVYFDGPKNDKFIKVITEEISKRGEPYEVKDHRIYSTAKGSYFEQMRKIIKYKVRPEWRQENPNFESETEGRIVMTWLDDEGSTDEKEKKYCHFVEAAVAKDGIDIEARRKHPEIWPPDVWPVPAAPAKP